MVQFAAKKECRLDQNLDWFSLALCSEGQEEREARTDTTDFMSVVLNFDLQQRPPKTLARA